MINVLVDSESLKSAANAIRKKTGTNTQYYPGTMADGINEVYVKGGTDGYNKGFDAGYEEGNTAGKKSQYDLFWDTFQDYGNQKYYSYAFHNKRFNDETFKPKYDIRPKDAQYMFYGSAITDIGQKLKDCGVVLDTSQCTNLDRTFYYAKGTIPVIDTRSCEQLLVTFCGNTYHTIEKLILKDDGSQTFPSTFADAGGLINILVEGCIGKSLDIGACYQLTRDSLIENELSIFNALKNYSGTTITATLTLGTTNLAKLTDAEKAIATEKGWTLA